MLFSGFYFPRLLLKWGEGKDFRFFCLRLLTLVCENMYNKMIKFVLRI